MTDARAWIQRVAASIRTRLVLTIVVVLAIGLGATAVGTRQVLLTRVDERIEDQLSQEAEELRAFASQGLDPVTGERFDTDAARMLEVHLAREVPVAGEVMITYIGGEPVQRTAQRVPYRVDTDPVLTERWGAVTDSDRGAVETPAGTFEYLAVPVRSPEGLPAVFLVGQFRDVVAAEVAQTVQVTAWVALASLVAGIGVAIALARRILTPLGRVTQAAEEITETDLSQRLPLDGHDEVARLSATFNGMLDRLQAAFDQQRQFVDDAGHELRTPITVIQGHLELLDDESSPAERAETRALVLDELARMHRMVEDLLTLAKVEQPDFVRPGPFDVDELTTSVHRKARGISREHHWHLDAVAVGQFVADPQRLTQALVALADNAAKHTPSGTTIGIGSRLDHAGLQLWVRDEGPGIASEDRDRVFDRFARGTEGPRRSDGAGLGLAIVRAIARAHEGTVTLESEPGRGATFALHLPAPSPTSGPPWDGDATDDRTSPVHPDGEPPPDDLDATRPIPVPESPR